MPTFPINDEGRPLKKARKSFRYYRLSARLALTAVLTSAIAAAAIISAYFYFNYRRAEALIRLQAAVETATATPPPPLAPPPPAYAARATPESGGPGLVKAGAFPPSKAGATKDGRRPKLVSSVSQGWGAGLRSGPRDESARGHKPDAGGISGPESEGDAITLVPAAAGRVRPDRAGPVSRELEKRYAASDPEADRLRRAAAELEEKKREAERALRKEKWLLAGWLALLSAAMTLLLSGVVRAWRLIHKPAGKHWTLE